MDQIKLLLVDSCSLIRTGFQNIDPNINLISEADNCQDAYKLYQSQRPDLVVLDLNIFMHSPKTIEPKESLNTNFGLELIRRLHAYDDLAKILVFTDAYISPLPTHACDLGANSFIPKHSEIKLLLNAMKQTVAGERVIADQIKQNTDNSNLSALTKREYEVFSYLAEGYSSREVAQLMFLSPKTVHAHRANIMEKLNLTNSAQLIHLGIRHGIV